MTPPVAPAAAAPRTTRRAVLTGTDRQPRLLLTFDIADRLPDGTPLLGWVRALPGRRWDRTHGCWVVTAVGRSPDLALARAGFEVDLDDDGADGSLRDVWSLAQVYRPLVKASAARPGLALVRPRLAGFAVTRDLLGPAATWDSTTGRFEVPVADLLVAGGPNPGLELLDDALAAARASVSASSSATTAPSQAAVAAATSTGVNLSAETQAHIEDLVAAGGDIPAWFGLDLYPYQRLGALAAVSGRSLICDPTGLGKTRTALAAIALRHAAGAADRAVIVVPPVVVTSWTREAETSGLASVPPRRTKKTANLVVEAASGPGRELVVFRAGRKEPDLPERGVVIVPDSLLASRPALLARLGQWQPGVLVYDEAHRARTWTSQRATSMRELCGSLSPGALRIAMTATPLFDSSPAELACPLAISGHLDPVFGGYSAFVRTYCRRNHFNALVANTKMLPALRALLIERVWVRRDKSEVLADLPAKSRHANVVDVDLAGFRAAHVEVLAKIDEWLDAQLAQLGRLPNDAEVEAWSRTQIGLMSPLRKAAGLAKVPVAIELVANWVEENQTHAPHGRVLFDNPLVVWAHHKEVVAALAAAVPEQLADRIAVIDGATPAHLRGELAEAFQAGELGALVCSIAAAGVGITLTRADTALFVESDFGVSTMSQAEDRIHRIGQHRPVTITTLVAAGTFDERIQDILARKATIIDAVTGDDSDVSVAATGGAGPSPAEIVETLVREALARR